MMVFYFFSHVGKKGLRWVDWKMSCGGNHLGDLTQPTSLPDIDILTLGLDKNFVMSSIKGYAIRMPRKILVRTFKI